MTEKTKLIAIVGPTASGKTSLSVKLAAELGGEVICCDSMQIYKEMNIGTAKPTPEEMAGVPHLLFDFVNPGRDFSCAEYRVLAEQTLRDVTERGGIPVFCGGTGLYLDSLLRGGELSPSVPEGLRKELEKRTPDSLWEELLTVDPDAAALTHKNNVKKVVRALEIYHGTGKTKTEWDRLSRDVPSPYDPLIIALDYKSRDVLYERIDRRVDIMLETGLLDEVSALRDKMGRTASQAIGYKELIAFLDGKCTYEEAVEELKKSTRNYAKRQLTYFRRMKDAVWLYPDAEPFEDIFENIVNIAKEHLNN